MRILGYATAAVTAVMALLNLPFAFDGDVAAPVGWLVTLLGVAGLVAAAGLLRRASWAPWAATAVGALNVAGALVALVSDREGAAVGLAVSLCGLVLATACTRTSVGRAATR